MKKLFLIIFLFSFALISCSRKDSDAPEIATVTMKINLPDAEFSDYQKVRVKATESHNLRGVVEFYQKGKENLVKRTEEILTPTNEEGRYTMNVEIPVGEYDMSLWIDYTEIGSKADGWYDTKSLLATKIIATDKSYVAGSDTREVFYATKSVAIPTSTASIDITTERPQAKYILVADDIKHYRELIIANPGKYPPLNQLDISVIYEGYLPDGFNVKTGKPNSTDMGYKFKNALPSINESDTEVQIASDYVFVNGEESSVTATVLVTDKEGNTVSRIPGVKVNYKRNMITTVHGDFLTAGAVTPGIGIIVTWSGVHEVEF